jgi:hypothetical protein
MKIEIKNYIGGRKNYEKIYEREADANAPDMHFTAVSHGYSPNRIRG